MDYGFLSKVLPTMLKNVSYDTICHEHIEYYSLKQIQWICNNTDLRIVDVNKSNANGGSIIVKCSHKNSKYKSKKKINNILIKEKNLGLDKLNIYKKFKINVEQSKHKLFKLIRDIKK